MRERQPENDRPEARRLARFLASLPLRNDPPRLIFEWEDGCRFKLTATLEQVEDIVDALEAILSSDADRASLGRIRKDYAK